MATEYELTLHDYLMIIRRRAPYLIRIFVALLMLSIVVTIAIPSTYRATGTIMVESPQVPVNIVPNDIPNLGARIDSILQRVMTRESLLQIANKYGLFKNSSRFAIFPPMTTEELIEKLRKRIVVEPVSSSDALQTNRNQSAISFKLSFEDRNPKEAFQVDNDLITIFLNQNVRMRNEGVAATTAFLTQEAKNLKLEVDRMEKKIAAYKQQNSGALPEQLTLRMTILSQAEKDLQEVERDYRSTKEDIRDLNVQLAAAKQGIGEVNNPSQPQPQTLSALKAEYARLSAIYTDAYPDVRIIKRKIDALEKGSVTSTAGVDATDSSNQGEYRIQSKIAEDNARLSSLEKQRKVLQNKITENENAMTKTPKVEQGLTILTRDRDAVQAKFEELRNKLMNAQMAQTLERENRSEQFTLLEPPLLPEKPFKPHRLKIFMLGFLLAIVSSGGIIIAWELVEKRIYGTDALTYALGYRPLVVIPYLPIQEEEEGRKRLRKLAIIIAVVVLVVLIVVLGVLNYFIYPSA